MASSGLRFAGGALCRPSIPVQYSSRDVSDPPRVPPSPVPRPVAGGRSRPGCLSRLSGETCRRARRRSRHRADVIQSTARSSRSAPRDGHDRAINSEREGAMPVIKPRTRGKQLVKHRTRLDRENNETLYAYAQFLGEPTEYVLNQFIDSVLARDKEFVTWRAEHPDSFVPGTARTARTETTGNRRAPPHRRRDSPESRRRRAARRAERGIGSCCARWSKRGTVALALAAATGVWGLHSVSRLARRPVPRVDCAEQAPSCFDVLAYGYATLWFTTPFFGASLVMSLARDRRRIVRAPSHGPGRCPRIRVPDARSKLTLVLGEAHFHTAPGGADPDLADHSAARPLHRHHDSRRRRHGQDVRVHVSVRGAAAPLASRRDEQQARRSGPGSEGRLLRPGAVDLAERDREGDYIEIGLDTGVCYNPLHNDLDPYAVAYAMATLLNNLFGRSKEPFWQQAYTDLLKFVILAAPDLPTATRPSPRSIATSWTTRRSTTTSGD